MTYVVRHDVEYKFHVVGVERAGERSQVLEGTEMLVHGVHVGGAVTVVTFRPVVLVNRRDPDCGDPEIL
jgi:hypothetical protein